MIKILFTWRYLTALAVTLLVLIIVYIILERTIFLLNGEEFTGFIESLGWAGPLVMVGLITVEVLVAPLPGGWLSVATGYLFGSTLGFIYAYIGNALGAWLAFELARVFGRPLVRRLVSEEKFERYQHKINRSSLGLGLLYAIPLFPIDVISLLLGISGISRKHFLLAMLLGFIPNMALLNFVGGAIAVPEYRYIMLALVVVVMGYFILRTVRERITPTAPRHSPNKPK